ncbi:unnamed protein product, partial [Ectocarpus sp. 8 AP-2014]
HFFVLDRSTANLPRIQPHLRLPTLPFVPPKEYGDVDPTVRGGYDFLDASLMQAGDNAPRPPPHIAAAAARALARAGVLRATSVRVRHCAHAYALVLTVASTAAKAAAAAASAVFSAGPSVATNAVFGGRGGGVADNQATQERDDGS